MNSLSRIALITTLLAISQSVEAKEGQDKKVPDTVRLCQAVVKSMLEGRATHLEVRGDELSVSEIEQVNIGSGAERVTCDIKCGKACGAPMSDILNGTVFQDGERVQSVNVAEMKGTSSIDGDDIKAPYTFTDIIGNANDIDYVCDKKVCRSFTAYTGDQQKALRQRFEGLVKRTLSDYGVK
ncbi:MAG: hypothetical protein WCT36_00850 [Candidatus Gracilibacteria bacterium]